MMPSLNYYEHLEELGAQIQQEWQWYVKMKKKYSSKWASLNESDFDLRR